MLEMQEDTTESTSPFTLREAIEKLCLITNHNPKTVEELFTFYLDYPITKLFDEQVPLFYRLGLKCGLRYTMIGRWKKGLKYQHDYMYDFRYIEDKEGNYVNFSQPVIWVIDYDTGALLHQNFIGKKIPQFTFWRKKRLGIKASLWDILDLQHLAGTEEPQTKESLREILRYHGINKDRNISISYCINFKKSVCYPYLTLNQELSHREDENISPTLSFFVYPTSATTQAYAFHQPPKKELPFFLPYEIPSEKDIPDPKPDTTNRRLAVHVQMTGLTLANKLGICDRQEMERLSTALSQCVGGLWITFDDEKHPRHVAFTAGTSTNNNTKSIKRHYVILETCDGENVEQWTNILNFIRACGLEARKEKETILANIFEKLEPFHRQKKRDLWCKCYNQLMASVRKYKVFLYGFDDTAIHAIKVPVAGIFKEKNHTVWDSTYWLTTT